MIVAEHGGVLEIVTQSDHARLAGRILELLPRLAQHPQRESLIFAAHWHDAGWQEVDSAPSTDRTGTPFDFLSQPTRTRLEIWRRSVERVLDKDPYAGLLVVLHASRLFEESLQRTAAPEVSAELKRLTAQRDELLETFALDAAQAESDYGWLDLADLLSLIVCNRWNRPFQRLLPDGTELRMHWDGEVLRLDPLLLAGSSTLSVSLRRIDRRTFDGSMDYAMALAQARWQERDVPIRGLAQDN